MTTRFLARSHLVVLLIAMLASATVVFPVAALAVCGDGTVDLLEACDDGNVVNGDCCSSTCQYEAFGSACADDGEFCTRDVCDGAGACIHDGSPLTTCLVAPKGKLQITNDPDDTKDKLVIQMQHAPGIPPAAFGSPTTSDAYHACIFGPDGLLMQAEVAPGGSCDGKPCWLQTKSGFFYKDTAGSQDGITLLNLKASAKPKTKILAKGKGAALDDPALPFPNAVMAQIVNAESGQCFESYFLEPRAVKKNSTEAYDAKVAAPGFEIPGLAAVIRQDDLDPNTPSPSLDAPGLVPPDPTKIFVQSISYEGSGCPLGTVLETLTGDRTGLNLVFSAFAATKGPAVPLTEAIKTCRLTLDLKVPQGWQYTIATVDHRGLVALPKKTKAIHQTSYGFAGDAEPVSVDSVFVGPVVKPYLIRDTLPFSTVVWSSCDVSRPLEITTELQVRGGTELGSISNLTVDGKLNFVLALQWKPCS